MSDSWRSRATRPTLTARAVESMSPGSLGGRIRQAAPVQQKVHDEPETFEGFVHVGPEDPPDTPTGRLWFDTDEPV